MVLVHGQRPYLVMREQTMDEATIKAIVEIVETSLSSRNGQVWLNRTRERLLRSVASRSFNTDRAIEMYTIAIERSVLSTTNGPTARTAIALLRESGVARTMARKLADQFKDASGATDNRAARTGLWSMVVGK
jgi:hypothetical protein